VYVCGGIHCSTLFAKQTARENEKSRSVRQNPFAFIFMLISAAFFYLLFAMICAFLFRSAGELMNGIYHISNSLRSLFNDGVSGL